MCLVPLITFLLTSLSASERSTGGADVSNGALRSREEEAGCRVGQLPQRREAATRAGGKGQQSAGEERERHHHSGKRQCLFYLLFYCCLNKFVETVRTASTHVNMWCRNKLNWSFRQQSWSKRRMLWHKSEKVWNDWKKNWRAARRKYAAWSPDWAPRSKKWRLWERYIHPAIFPMFKAVNVTPWSSGLHSWLYKGTGMESLRCRRRRT